MPKIIGLEEQQAALKEIRDALKEIKHINSFLEHENEGGKYTISFIADDGTRCSATAFANSKEEVDSLIQQHKTRIRNHVRSLAEKNRIHLEIEEKLDLGFELTFEEQAKLEAEEYTDMAAEEDEADEENCFSDEEYFSGEEGTDETEEPQ